MREVKASEFKATCLALIDEVNASGEPIIITKRGKRVARLEAERGEPTRPLFGSMRELLELSESIEPSDGAFSDDIKGAIEERLDRQIALISHEALTRKRR